MNREKGDVPFIFLYAGRERGNVLITAIFVAMFLFLLASALVAMNRQDILLSLKVDHGLRAEMAAQAGAHWALQTMRNDPNWEATLTNAKGTMQSGATWTVTVSPYPDPQNTGYLLDILGTGQSGVFTSEHHIIAEEIRLASNLSGGAAPLLFADANPNSSSSPTPIPNPSPTPAGPELLVMNSTFRWTDTTLHAPFPGAQLAAGGGPLFGYAPKGSAARATQVDFASPSPGPLGTPTPVPLGTLDDHLLFLTYSNALATWNDIPDPGPALGQSLSATINGTASTALPTPGSQYVGPQIEWYGVQGPTLAAMGTKVYCWATHSVYQGSKFSVGAGSVILASPPPQEGHVISLALAVLAYDLTSKTWSKIVETMPVTNLQSPPQSIPQPQPSSTNLAVVGTNVYAYQAVSTPSTPSPSPTPVLMGAGNNWTPFTIGDGTTLFGYASKLITHTNNGTTDNPVNLVEGDLGVQIPAVRSSVFNSETQQFQTQGAVPEEDVSLSGTGRAGSVSVLGSDVYALVQVQTTYKNDNQPYLPPFTPAFLTSSAAVSDWITLGHYDGKHWQIWPNGLHGQVVAMAPTPVPTPGTSPTPMPTPVNGSLVEVTDVNGNTWALQSLTMALYTGSSNAPLSRRYAPVVVER